LNTAALEACRTFYGKLFLYILENKWCIVKNVLLSEEWKFRQEQNAIGLKKNLEQNVDNRRFNRLPRNSIHDRIEDINNSMLSTVEEESESDQTHSSRCETYTLTRITNAADNKGYGLEDIENIGGSYIPKTAEAPKDQLRG